MPGSQGLSHGFLIRSVRLKTCSREIRDAVLTYDVTMHRQREPTRSAAYLPLAPYFPDQVLKEFRFSVQRSPNCSSELFHHFRFHDLVAFKFLLEVSRSPFFSLTLHLVARLRFFLFLLVFVDNARDGPTRGRISEFVESIGVLLFFHFLAEASSKCPFFLSSRGQSPVAFRGKRTGDAWSAYAQLRHFLLKRCFSQCSLLHGGPCVYSFSGASRAMVDWIHGRSHCCAVLLVHHVEVIRVLSSARASCGSRR